MDPRTVTCFYRRTRADIPGDAAGTTRVVTIDMDPFDGQGHGGADAELMLLDIPVGEWKPRLRAFHASLATDALCVHIRVDVHTSNYAGMRLVIATFGAETALFHPPCTELSYLGNPSKALNRPASFERLTPNVYTHTEAQLEQRECTLRALDPVMCIYAMIADPSCPLRNAMIENPMGLMFDGLCTADCMDSTLRYSPTVTLYHPFQCGPVSELTSADMYTKKTGIIHMGPQSVIDANPLDCDPTRKMKVAKFLEHTNAQGGDTYARNTTNPAQTRMLMGTLIARDAATRDLPVDAPLTPAIVHKPEKLAFLAHFSDSDVNKCGQICAPYTGKARKFRTARRQSPYATSTPSVRPCTLHARHLGNCNPRARFRPVSIVF